jgi:hypothetical protein
MRSDDVALAMLSALLPAWTQKRPFTWMAPSMSMGGPGARSV